MSEYEWMEYRCQETKPDCDRQIEVRMPAYLSGGYLRADMLCWDYMPTDGSVRWRYA